MKKIILLMLLTGLANQVLSAPGCVGRFTNPITDVCWKCMFPLTIAGVSVVPSGEPDTASATSFLPICWCKRSAVPLPVPGIPISYWEPARLVDVTKSPMCMVALGGFSVGNAPQKGMRDDTDGSAFYHVHWYIYPVLHWLELLMDFGCMEMASIDVAYLTEFDPLWSDDTKSIIR